MGDLFVNLSLSQALQITLLGLMGGLLSGFIGSGGAFFMTPGLMNIGAQGVIAVGSNISHKFGMALIGSKKHAELGHVDKKLGIFLLITAFAGIRIAIWVSSYLFGIGGGEGNQGAASNLYISAVFVLTLSFVSASMLLDVLRKKSDDEGGPSRKIYDRISKLRLFPMIYFPVADVRVSLWVLLFVGLFLGYMAGTIGVEGPIAVPAMIYIFGIPTAVAAGTELFLAIFTGGFGAINYALAGFVDIRLIVLLYLGSLLGIFVGAYGTKVVGEKMIRLVSATVVFICVISRAIAIPIYLVQLKMIDFIDPSYLPMLNLISKYFLYGSGLIGTVAILINVIKAYIRKKQVYATIITKT